MDYESIKDIRTESGYNVGGISRIWILKIDDFKAFRFKDDKLYNQSLVEKIAATSGFVEIETVEESSFTETKSNGVYVQQLNSFIGKLSAPVLSNLLLTESEKYLVAFRTVQGQNFVFGSDGGAEITFNQQTGSKKDISGYNISIAKSSVYPLFEILDLKDTLPHFEYEPHFTKKYYQIINGKKTGYEIAAYMTKQTSDGLAVDYDGNLCKGSKKKQAIYLLKGASNPDANIYTVENTYSEDVSYVNGTLVVKFDFQQSASNEGSSIWLSESQIIFSKDYTNSTIQLTSLDSWSLVQYSDIASCSSHEGHAGTTDLTFDFKEELAPTFFVFRNNQTNQTARISIVYDETAEWVLTNGVWNDSGIWMKNQVWE